MEDNFEELELQRNERWALGIKHPEHKNWTIYPITGEVFDKNQKQIGCITKEGYVLSGHNILHRIIYEAAYNIKLVKSNDLAMNEVINHIDFVRSNNKITNLEVVSIQKNNQWKLNRTGRWKGVSFNQERQNWQSELKYNYIGRFLGYYKTELEGGKAYNSYAKYINETFDCKYLLNEIIEEDYEVIPLNIPEINRINLLKTRSSQYIGVQYHFRRDSFSVGIKYEGVQRRIYGITNKVNGLTYNECKILRNYNELECAKISNQQRLYYNNHNNKTYELNIIPEYIDIEKDIYSEFLINKEKNNSNEKSKYNGVRPYKNTTSWTAFYSKKSKQISIGKRYDTELEAAIAYNTKMIEINLTNKYQYKINTI